MISWCLNIVLLILLVAVVIEYKAYGAKCYCEGREYARFAGMIPDEDVRCIVCGNGDVYVREEDRFVKVMDEWKKVEE